MMHADLRPSTHGAAPSTGQSRRSSRRATGTNNRNSGAPASGKGGEVTCKPLLSLDDPHQMAQFVGLDGTHAMTAISLLDDVDVRLRELETLCGMMIAGSTDEMCDVLMTVIRLVNSAQAISARHEEFPDLASALAQERMQ